MKKGASISNVNLNLLDRFEAKYPDIKFGVKSTTSWSFYCALSNVGTKLEVASDESFTFQSLFIRPNGDGQTEQNGEK